MSRGQALFRVELPLAARVIFAGVRISVIINIGTAMIGAVIGAGGLGSPIVAGLVQDNLAFVIEGALPAAMLAILADQFLANIEGTLAPLAGLHAASELWVPVHVVGRVDTPAAPFLALLAAGGAALLAPRLRVAGVLTLVGLAAAPVAVEITRDTRSQERNISAALAPRIRPGDAFVVTGPFRHAYEYYLGRFAPRTSLLVYPLQREEHPSWLDSRLMDEETLLREAETVADRAFLQARQEGGTAAWLLRDPASHADFVARALAARAAASESFDPRYLGLRIERHALPPP